jgi:hypothetical protein
MLPSLCSLCKQNRRISISELHADVGENQVYQHALRSMNEWDETTGSVICDCYTLGCSWT